MINMMDDKRKDPPQASFSDVGELLASECFEALKRNDKSRFSMCLKEMVALEIMKNDGGRGHEKD
jgi:hypothetical protein